MHTQYHMMRCSLPISVLLVGAMNFYQVFAVPAEMVMLNKVFTYQGSMPIKEDRNEEVIKNQENSTAVTTISPSDLAMAEAACWAMINEQSVVTFAMQNRVLDELARDMKDLKMDEQLRVGIEKIAERMRSNMQEALEALKRDAADEYFDALFDASEDIINMSSLLRTPHLDEHVFLTLIKGVSRLGRNNSALIQEFTDMCSFKHRSPRPRTSSMDS